MSCAEEPSDRQHAVQCCSTSLVLLQVFYKLCADKLPHAVTLCCCAMLQICNSSPILKKMSRPASEQSTCAASSCWWNGCRYLCLTVLVLYCWRQVSFRLRMACRPHQAKPLRRSHATHTPYHCCLWCTTARAAAGPGWTCGCP